MKSWIFAFLLFSFPSFAQEDTVFMRYNSASPDEALAYRTDTLIFYSQVARTMLHGTTMLPSTNTQQYAMGFGLYLQNVTGSDCSGHDEDRMKSEILSLSETDSSWVFHCRIIGNCCHSFLGDVTVEGDSVINLLYYGYGSGYCACYCCFGQEYTFALEREFSEFDKLKYVMINGEVETMKGIGELRE